MLEPKPKKGTLYRIRDYHDPLIWFSCGKGTSDVFSVRTTEILLVADIGEKVVITRPTKRGDQTLVEYWPMTLMGSDKTYEVAMTIHQWDWFEEVG